VIPHEGAWWIPFSVVKLVEKVAALQSSAHTGRALKAAKVLNLIGTVRGAVTTVLLASSAIGGAVTVNNVRQDIVKDQAAATPTRAAAKTTPPPTPTPLTAAGLRSDSERRLRTTLDQLVAGVEDMRRVSILGQTATDALVLTTRQKLQARFDLAMTQIDQLLAPPASSPAPSGTPQPSASLSVVAANALVQVALGDMNGILNVATRQATTEIPVVIVQTPKPTVAPTPFPTARTPLPTFRTATPTVRPSATR
jgi:hypothetical protein